MGFKIGERVVCFAINNIDNSTGEIYPHLKKNEIVIITAIDDDEIGFLTFKEYSDEFEYENYNFRKLDYQFVEELLSNIKQQELIETI